MLDDLAKTSDKDNFTYVILEHIPLFTHTKFLLIIVISKQII